MKKLKLLLTQKVKRLFITMLRKQNYKLIMILKMLLKRLLRLTKRKLRLIKLQRRLPSQMHRNTLRLRLKDKLTLLPKPTKMLKMLRLKHTLLPPKLPKLQFKIMN
tara:strand:+ start:426 stop:743 length:318 start_codon:yes stop_codon:yes gene_type:complete